MKQNKEKLKLKFCEIKNTDLEGNFYGGDKIDWISYSVDVTNMSDGDIKIRIFGIYLNENMKGEIQFMVYHVRFPFVLEPNECRCLTILGEQLQHVLDYFKDEINVNDYLTFYIEDSEERKYEVNSSMKIEDILKLKGKYCT